MLLKNALGREIEIDAVYGRYEDDIEIGAAGYVDTGEEVSEEDIEYLYATYAAELLDAWYERQRCMADYYYERD